MIIKSRVILIVLSFLTVFTSYAQLDDKGFGITWFSPLSWEAAKAKASQEHKFIFLDCYTTWCAPCRFMADSIFTKKDIGKFINENFVSIKVQMDTSKFDDSYIKSWYAEAHNIMNENEVDVFPTYLFFTSEGQIVHMGTGLKTTEVFLKLAADALDTSNQYFTLLRNYEYDKNYSDLLVLGEQAEMMGKKNVVETVRKKYLKEYLNVQPEADLLSRINLNRIYEFRSLLSPDDSVVNVIRSKRKIVDSISGIENFSDNILKPLISREELKPIIDLAERVNKEPDWSRIQKTLSIKYGTELIGEQIAQAKSNYYRNHDEFKKYAAALILYVEKYAMKWIKDENAGGLNNAAWDIFKISNDKTQLETALRWSDRVLKATGDASPGLMDTKANILYKLGRIKEAIALQEQAIESMYQNYEKKQGLQKGTYSKELIETLKKMKAGTPTWDGKLSH